MEQNFYFKVVSRSLNLGMEVLSPFKMTNQKKILSKRYSAIGIGIFSLIVAAAIYAIDRFDQLSFSAMANIASLSIMFTRLTLYVLIVMKFHSRISRLVRKIINDRKNIEKDSDIWQLTVNHSRNEFIALNMIVSSVCIFAVVFTFGVYWFTNNLPYPLVIIWLPFEGISINWLLNYCYQLYVILCVLLFFAAYCPITLILLNHSCWKLDALLVIVADCKEKSANKKSIKKIIVHSLHVLEWLQDVQECLGPSIMVDFTSQAILLCSSLCCLSIDPWGSPFSIAIVIVTLNQLFIYCWMGTRVVERIEKLASAVYDLDWYEMPPKQRKDVQLILIMSQNMKGLNGIFKQVNMETFQKILEFAYSAFALLKSMT